MARRPVPHPRRPAHPAYLRNHPRRPAHPAYLRNHPRRPAFIRNYPRRPFYLRKPLTPCLSGRENLVGKARLRQLADEATLADLLVERRANYELVFMLGEAVRSLALFLKRQSYLIVECQMDVYALSLFAREYSFSGEIKINTPFREIENLKRQVEKLGLCVLT